MVQSYAIKRKKRKTREEKYDREEDQEVEVEEKESAKRASIEKPKWEAQHKEVEQDEFGAHELMGIPIAHSDQKTNKKRDGYYAKTDQFQTVGQKGPLSSRWIWLGDTATLFLLCKNTKVPLKARQFETHLMIMAISM
ncbi:hypothetical protein QQP08_003248, partial [Theobroma cacao]